MSRFAAAVVLVALGAWGFAGPAAASQGSVPGEVAAYAADPDGLLATLEDFVGVGADGKGIDFGEASEVGQLNRIFTFTDAWLAGEATDTPVERANEWTAPITIAGKPIGLAIIWINPATVKPELADFVQDIDAASALADVPTDAYLVHDGARDAWFTLVPPALTPVLVGTSGVTAPTTLSTYQARRSSTATVVAENPGAGSAPSIVIIVVALGIIAALLVAVLRARRRAAAPE